jgi:hypothetical protein
MKLRTQAIPLAALILSMICPCRIQAGDFERLYYDFINGTPMDNFRNAVDSSRVPSDPNDATYYDFPLGYSYYDTGTTGLRRTELTGIVADNFGSLIRAYIQPPLDGDYQFFIASDDTSEFYISTSESPLDIRAQGNFLSASPAPAAYETGCCTEVFTGDRLDQRRSAPITLQKGKQYYIEIYQKEGGGGAWVQLGWQRPDGVQELIPASAVLPYIFPESPYFSVDSGIVASPDSQTVLETQPVTFSVNVVMQPPLAFQWYENGNPISGATLATYSIPMTTLAMNGNTYSVKINGTASADATLTVQADPTPPTIVSAIGSAFPQGIVVYFSKVMDAVSILNAANYSFQGQSLTVQGVEALSASSVLIKVSQYTSDPLTLKVDNVKDATSAGNTIAANTTAQVVLAVRGAVVANLFTGLTAGTDGTGPTETQRTRDLPNFPDSPNWSQAVSGLNVPQTSATFGPGGDLSNFQTYIAGYLIAPQSGDYTIYIASDDASAFYLSTDANPANLPPVDIPTVHEDTCCRALGTVDDGQLNAIVTLEANKLYYFEAYAAEYGGGDFLQVGWITPGNSAVAVIPAGAVASDLPTSALAISQQPASQTILENTPVTFSVTAQGSSPAVLTYQWFRDGVAITGATGSSYTINSAQLADNGAKFSVKIANGNGSYNEPLSNDAVLTVSNDSTAPAVLKIAGTAALNKVVITFDEPLDAVTSQALTSYSIAGLQITSAILAADGKTVTLTTSAQTQGTRYDVVINGVTDVISANNKVNFTGNFRAFDLGKGGLSLDIYTGVPGGLATDLFAPTVTKYPNNPDASMVLSSFSWQPPGANGYAETYGARLKGWFYPPVTGDYRFFLRSDDGSQLYFNPNGPAEVSELTGGVPIAEETGCCGVFMEPETGDPATSLEAYHLTAGNQYYIEAILKENTGGDWLQVAYRLEGDTTAASTLQPIPGRYLGTLMDLDVNLQVTKAPSDALGVLASDGVLFQTEDFATDAGFTVVTTGDVPGPWLYDGVGTWQAAGGNDACGDPQNSALISPEYTMTQAGALTLTLDHRYSFESGFDGGQVQVSVNDGPFTAVPAENFQQNGYASANLGGNGVLLGLRAFNGDSAGYASGANVTSIATLGTFKQGDNIRVQFLAAWDECTTGTQPNWVIDSMNLKLLPMIIQDFRSDNGNYTVQTTGTPPGPWTYDSTAGAWIAKNGNVDCGDANNSALVSPAYIISQADEVTLSFTHRYSFEAVGFDGGQVRISVNGGPFTPVSADKFSANGYATDLIVGTGVLNGQRAFNGDSPGYANTNYITSSVVLGNFNQNDTITVEFLAAWDECSTASIPNWTIKNATLSIGKAAKSSTFEVLAESTLHGDPMPISYQWQRDDGTGFVDIPGATGASFTIYPKAADFASTFRALLSTPGAIVTTDPVKLVTSISTTPPDLAVTIVAGKVNITFTGTLQSSATVDGTYQNVTGASNPYIPANTGPAMFFRAVK